MARRLSIRYRWAVASRAVAAIVGGYALTSLFTAALALLLRHVWAMARVDAVLTATMASFLVYAVAAIAVFYARSPIRAWTGLVLASLPPALVLVFLWRGRG